MASGSYQMWINSDGEKNKLQIPVLPEKIDVKNSMKTESVNIVDLGEITLPGSRQAAVISFSSFFPAQKYSGMSNVAKLHPPWFYAAKLRNLLNAGNPVRFILNGGHINMFATIESFQCYEKGGDAGTIYYSIQFKEYREISVKQIKIKKASGTSKKTASVNKTAARVNSKSTPKTYTVKKGDCLWNIAKKYLGSGSRYMEIFNLNKDKLKDPNKIKIGQVLKLTAK